MRNFVRGLAVAAALLGAPEGEAHAQCAQAPSVWSTLTPDQVCERLYQSSGELPRTMRLPGRVLTFLEKGPAVASPGAPAALPWLLVHGFGGRLCDFAPIILEASKQRPVLALDLPGFGGSVSLDNDYSIDAYARTVRDFVARTGHAKVRLVCHSMGGQICLALALMKASFIHDLVLIDAAGIYEPEEFIRDLTHNLGRVSLGEVVAKKNRSLLDFLVGNDLLFRRFMVHNAATLAAISSFRSNYRSEVHTLDLPTLLLWGMDDPLFPVENAVFLKENIKGSRLVIIDGARHEPQLSHPEVVMRLMQRYQP
jgi:pyruvate dehydrogenase E2 component (dihydrolipoamide acetyltransferase)